MCQAWVRLRFCTRADDWRPLRFPPPGPYWNSGYGDDYNIMVAYFPLNEEPTLMEYWPDAYEIDMTLECGKIRFSKRFPRPEWWADDA